MRRGGLAHCRSQRPYTIRLLRRCAVRPLRPYTIRLLRPYTIRLLRPCAVSPLRRCGGPVITDADNYISASHITYPWV